MTFHDETTEMIINGADTEKVLILAPLLHFNFKIRRAVSGDLSPMFTNERNEWNSVDKSTKKEI